MQANPALWSSIGFWILVAGLVGEGIVIVVVPSGKLEKALSVLCTILIIAGVTIEHVADAKRFGPRRLSADQVQHLVTLLKPFAGQEFSLAVAPDPEAIDLLKTIDSVVNAAGWRVIPAQMQSDVAVGKAAQVFTTGVRIQFAMNASAETIRRAKILAAALNDDGIWTIAEPNPDLKSASALNVVGGARG